MTCSSLQFSHRRPPGKVASTTGSKLFNFLPFTCYSVYCSLIDSLQSSAKVKRFNSSNQWATSVSPRLAGRMKATNQVLSSSNTKIHRIDILSASGSVSNFWLHRTFILMLLCIINHSKFASSLSMSTGGIGCRTETGIELPFHLYALDTCAKCYFYMPTWAFTDRLSYTGLGQLQDPWTNVTYMANDTAELEKSFVSPMMILKWKQCCEDAIGCCLNQLSVKDKATGGCPRTWDGWTCWPDNLAVGGVSSQACPRHIYWRMAVPPCRGYATKTCTSDGQWYSIENREWTNYTNCARDDIYLRRLRYSIATHLISIAIIIPALFIFNYYRQLSATPRIRLHKHLFACLLLYATLSALLKFYLLETETELSNAHSEANYDDNSTAYCLALSLALRYFRSATYLWMFNEAFYLHRLIKKAFSHPSVTPLIFFAYGLSFLTTLSYIICRSLVSISDGELDVTMSKHDLVAASLASDESYSGQDGCWLLPANEPWKEWVINGPNLCILLVNCLLLWPIIMEIYKKANSGPSPSPHSHPQRNLIKQNSGQAIMTKANFMVPLRAATLLLPLYGLHFLLIVYRPDIDVCWLSELYHYGSLTLDGLQGSLVSILFCFANNEVRQLVWKSMCHNRDANLYLTEVVPAPHE